MSSLSAAMCTSHQATSFCYGLKHLRLAQEEDGEPGKGCGASTCEFAKCQASDMRVPRHLLYIAPWSNCGNCITYRSENHGNDPNVPLVPK